MDELSISPNDSTCPSNLVNEIRAQHAAAMSAASSAIDHAIACGELLLSAKRGMPHGTFTPWLRQHVEFSPRTARNYMLLATEKDFLHSKRQSSAVLSIQSGLGLLAARKPTTSGECLVGDWPATFEQRLVYSMCDSEENLVFIRALDYSPEHVAFVSARLSDTEATFTRRGIRADTVRQFLESGGFVPDRWNAFEPTETDLEMIGFNSVDDSLFTGTT